MRNITKYFAFFILAILIAGCEAQKTDRSILIMPNQGKMQCNLVMEIEGERNVFALTVPETIGNRNEMLLNFPETELAWDGPDEVGVVRTQWTKDSVISYSLELIPGKDFIDANMIINNLSQDRWEDVWSFNCLNPVKAPSFQDLKMDRTYMSTGDGPKRLSDTKRTIGHRPSIGIYFSEKMELDEQWAFISWFEATSPERTNGDYLCTLSESGDAYMAATSPNTLYLFNNLEFTCIHAAPTFGDMEPGESKSLSTRFYFGEGDLSSFIKRFGKENKER